MQIWGAAAGTADVRRGSVCSPVLGVDELVPDKVRCTRKSYHAPDTPFEGIRQQVIKHLGSEGQNIPSSLQAARAAQGEHRRAHLHLEAWLINRSVVISLTITFQHCHNTSSPPRCLARQLPKQEDAPAACYYPGTEQLSKRFCFAIAL